MPIVLRIGGFQVRIFLPGREHPPAHVHVFKAGGEVVIELGAAGARVAIREIKGMRRADVHAAVDLVEEHAAYLRTQWRKYHE